MARPRTASSRKPPARRRGPRAGQLSGRGTRLRAVPGVDPGAAARERVNAQTLAERGERFDAREALRRSGLSAGDDLAKTGGLAQDLAGGASRWWRRDPTLRAYHPVSFAELAVFAGASLLGLALLDTALRGRGPAGVERVLAGLGAGVRRLFDPRDTLVRAGDAPAFTPPVLGTEAYGDLGPRPEEGAAGERTATRAGGVFPLGRRGKLIGTPHAGTHTRGNWQSDNALDFAVPVGTPVYAVTSGRISPTLGYGDTGQGGVLAGKRLHLEADGGNAFYYAHLSRIVVPRGARVREGQLIGYSGSAVGVPHLHFGVKQGSPFAWAEAQLRQAASAVRRAVGARER